MLKSDHEQIDRHETLQKRARGDRQAPQRSHEAVACNQTNKAAAMTTLTAGPASATHNSCIGWEGIFSRRATPPMGSKMMSRVAIPYRLAISA